MRRAAQYALAETPRRNYTIRRGVRSWQCVCAWRCYSAFRFLPQAGQSRGNRAKTSDPKSSEISQQSQKMEADWREPGLPGPLCERTSLEALAGLL